MIYLDNAATGWPKPYGVVHAVREGLTDLAANPGRGGYEMSMRTSERLYETRQTAAKLFGAPGPERVIFTSGCTQSLNLAFKCFLPEGAHVVVSDREHNAVMRPLTALAKAGKIRFDVAQIGGDTEHAAAHFARRIRQETRMLVCTQVSNVDGARMPIGEIGRLAARFGLLFCVDAAQSAGCIPIDMERDCIDLLCVPGHKGLCGPMGTGLLVIGQPEPLTTLIEGGTGSRSDSFEQPEELPDRLESGTPNVAGILGLNEGMKFIESLGPESIFLHERQLRRELKEALSDCGERLRLYEPAEPTNILLFSVRETDSEQAAARLAERGICVRAGLHCAPAAHRVIGTPPDGAVRVSLGVYNDSEQIARCAEAIRALCDP